MFLEKREFDEIIIVKNGLITDTSIANIAIFDGRDWLTPKTPLLFGTTRARFIDNKILKLKDLTPQDFKKAKKIALLNGMIGFNIIFPSHNKDY